MSGNAVDDRVSSGLGDKFKVSGWNVDVRALEITNGEETRKLESKVMNLLVCLAGKPGEAMTRGELEETVWRDVIVGYDSLTNAVIKLRKAFGDTSRRPTIVETIPKVGYRLIAEVEPDPPESQSVADPGTVGRPAPGENAASLAASVPQEAARQTRRRLPIAAAAIALLVAVAGVIWWRPWAPDVAPARTEAMAFPLPGKPSIAVLAFKNLSQDPAQEYLGDAMAENIITELSRFSELFVIAGNSSFAYMGKPVDVRQIAEDLGVRYVVEGSLQRAGDRLRVTVQLIDALAGTHVWAERYDRDAEDIFALQDEITRTVVATVARTVEVKERDRAARKQPAGLAAYEYYLRGMKFWYRWTEEGTEQASRMFDKALELDPKLARGYVGRARVYLNGYRWGFADLPREEALERALAAAKKSVELDPFDYDTHNVLAYIQMRSGSLEEADAGFETSLKLNPNAGNVLVNVAEMRTYQGRAGEAVDLIKQAMRLNPHHPDWYYWVLADAQSVAGQPEGALATMNKMSNIHQKPARRTLALIYVRLGRLDEGRAVMAEYLKNNPGFTLTKYRQYLQTLPIQVPAIIDDVIVTMRKAGVPE